MTDVKTRSDDTAAASQPRLKERYRSDIAGKLREQYGYANPMQVPGLVKIVVNRGVGVTVVTTARTDAEGRALLRLLGFPFREDQSKES